MLKLFEYDNANKRVVINEADILLIKEFAALWNEERNITKKDKTGVNKTKAFREFSYIYLAIDWKSPYSQYPEQERHQEALMDGGITPDEFDDTVFRLACRKYKEIQEQSKIGLLLKSQYGMLDRMTQYFDNLDFNERDPVTQKPVYKMKDVQVEIAQTNKVLEGIKSLEEAYRNEQKVHSGYRGDKEPGYFDDKEF